MIKFIDVMFEVQKPLRLHKLNVHLSRTQSHNTHTKTQSNATRTCVQRPKNAITIMRPVSNTKNNILRPGLPEHIIYRFQFSCSVIIYDSQTSLLNLFLMSKFEVSLFSRNELAWYDSEKSFCKNGIAEKDNTWKHLIGPWRDILRKCQNRTFHQRIEKNQSWIHHNGYISIVYK